MPLDQDRLIICEKPSQANDIAKVLKIRSRGDGCLYTDAGVVTWQIGHLLRSWMPEDYNPEWKDWSKRPVPMVPSTWKMKEDPLKVAQLRAIKKLLTTAKEVVIACDAGREGEMIAREVLEFYGFKGKILRLWISNLTEDAIKDGFANLWDGKRTEFLYEAAVARSNADFLWGLNLSTQLTLHAGSNLPIGRVQTPTLALLVNRHLEIENFKPKTYFDLAIEIASKTGEKVQLKYSPKEDKRIFEEKEALAILDEFKGKSLPLSVEKKETKEAPPLFFSLSTLQADANRVLGFSAQQTLDKAQLLYDKKLISYPRTDSAHLGKTHIEEVPKIISALRAIPEIGDIAKKLTKETLVLRSSTFDDTKLTDHHGIIPTHQVGAMPDSQSEKLYLLICKRFLQQLHPDCIADVTTLCISKGEKKFTKTGKIVKIEGWRSV